MSTAQDILYDARALIDEYNEDGVVISSSDTDIQTMELNGLRFINMAVQEIYKYSKIYEEFPIVQKPIPNLLGDQFDIVQFIGNDLRYPQTEEGVVGAKAYYFTADSDATVLIREYNGSTWNTLLTLNVTPTEKTAYKGLITATDPSYPIEMLFTGTTFYNHKDRCLYSYPFKSDTIPDYEPWIRYEMPSDFGIVHEIIAEYPHKQYASISLG